MSTFTPHRLRCPCGCELSVDVAIGIHATRLPWARQQILDETFQQVVCRACGMAYRVVAPCVYVDLQRQQYLAVEPMLHGRWPSVRRRHERAFDQAFNDGPPIAGEIGVRLKKRCVTGWRAAREKLMLWDAGLDDLVVEGIKGHLAQRLGLSPADALFRLAGELPGGHLCFYRYAPIATAVSGERPDVPERVLPPQRPVDMQTAPAALCMRCAEDRADIGQAYPWLRNGWLVDFHDGWLAHAESARA